MSVKIYGFTLLRNAVHYDYPFRESLLSMKDLCEEVHIAIGDCKDSTKDAISDLEFLKPFDTVWDPSMMGDGGQILSEQTNLALNKLREAHGQEENAWGIYLQADEVLHEDEINLIKRDIEKAEQEGCDALSFRYFHFWLDHDHIAINKRWYPVEVRAIKLDSNIQSFGDAQGFSGVSKAFETNAHIFHYGHVRDRKKHQEKQLELIKLIRPGEKLKKYLNREKKAFANTKTLKWLGSHPSLMKERISRMGDRWEVPEATAVSIVGAPESFKSYRDKINAKEVSWVNSKSEAPDNSIVINFKAGFLNKIFSKSIPSSMESPLARPWTDEIYLMLLLSSKGISFRR